MVATPTTEDARAFLQDRLSVLGRWLLIMGLALNAVGAVLGSIMLPGGAEHLGHMFTPPVLAIYALTAGLWLGLRRGRVRAWWLQAIDVATMLAVGTVFALILSEERDQGFEDFALLGAVVIVIARAIVVPSTAKRTIWISILSVAPAAVATTLLKEPDPDALLQARSAFAVNNAIWATFGITVAAVGSRIIYGLRTEIGRARKLGQYHLDEKIGEGGGGVVYKASHSMLRRPTAIKLLQHVSEHNLKRFSREVRLTAQLTHPNTVAVYDYGRTPDGVFYYAMELLDGLDLQQLVSSQGRAPPARVVHIVRQVADALTEAHGIGLIHRDIKPANIILCERGGRPDVAKVVDFGLVKTVDEIEGSLILSAENLVVGTPLYLSPEAISTPESVDGRSDLYAVGAVGYYLLTGTPVFKGVSVIEVCSNHLHTEPDRPSERINADLPADVEDVILKCLSKRPEDRFENAAALVKALDGCAVARAWTVADAAAWWKQFREDGMPEPASKPDHDVVETLAVSLEERRPAG